LVFFIPGIYTTRDETNNELNNFIVFNTVFIVVNPWELYTQGYFYALKKKIIIIIIKHNDEH